MLNNEIILYNNKLSKVEKDVFTLLATTIDNVLYDAESKIWHSHPVWFLDGNPIVGYSKHKAGIKLLFWSGADFEEDKLVLSKGKFKDASILFNTASEINIDDLERWLLKSREIQWDYKNLVKRKGQLERLK